MSLNLESNFLQFNFEMDNGSKHTIYGFDRFRLDAGKLMLYDGESPVRLPPKCVNTLAVLVENAGEIISKDDLIDAVWQDSIVEESNLSQYLYLLRKTLGSRDNGQPYIETLRRRGYRFNGEPALINPQPKTQRPARAEPARVVSFSAETRGNVVALTEWKEAEQIKPDPPAKIALVPQPSVSNVSRRLTMALALLAVLLVSSTGYLIFNRNAAATPQQAAEITNLRLTNGLEPAGATVSPDGKYFVYHEQSGPVYRLWLQQTGYSTRVEIIPASEKPIIGATFSPDSQYIYFLAVEPSEGVNSLYRVPTLGGPVAKILSPINSYVSFSPDGGEFVFARYDTHNNETQYVVRASSNTGEERIIHRLAGPLHGNPAWAPDGNRIVYTKYVSRDVNIGTCMLESLDMSDGFVKPASDERWDTCYRMAWKPDGRGFYLIGTKEAEGMTPRRDQLYFVSYPEGRSRKVTTDSTSRHQAESLGVTKDGAVLTVPFNRASQIWAMDANGDSRTAVQLTSGINDGRAGLAPRADGSIAYVNRSADNLNISVMNQDGSDQKTIVTDPPVLEELRSSRGSRYMVFASPRGENRSHLFRVNLDGSDRRQLTFGDSYEVDSSISNDGNWVAYGRTVLHDSNFDVSLWKIPIDGGEPVRLKQIGCEMPHFSPDDKLISCVERQTTIHILSADDGTLISSLPVQPLAAPSFGARWTPDGKSVAYIVTEKGVSNIWLHPVEGGASKPLTNFTVGSIYHFAYSTDGTRLFVARGQQIRDAVLIKGAG